MTNNDNNFERFSSLQNNPYINQNAFRANNRGFAPNINPNSAQKGSIFGNDFLKGALIGATVTYLLTNKDAQKSLFTLFNKASSMMQMGIEELKERYEDLKAELETQE